MARKLPAGFHETAVERIRESRTTLQNWRKDARDDYAFVSGEQWIETDRMALEAQKRPPVTFNYSEKMIDAVVGAEVGNRQEVRYGPREMGDDPTAELLTQAAQWARDQCDAEDQDTDAFRDMLICGLGWTETRMNYDTVPDGMIEVERIDPLEMGYDTAATKRGLADTRFRWREWWVNEKDAKLEWPNLLGYDSTSGSDTPGGSVVTRGTSYDRDDEREEEDAHKGQVKITHYQCVEREPFYRVADADQIHELSPADFSKLRATFDQLGVQYVKQYRLVYYRAFLSGDTLLDGGPSPCQDGFTFQCITGKRDRNKNTWYGLTRVMKDPQRWANKWLSQIIHIINVNAKGGLMAETGAFADPRRAQDEWSQADSITLLQEGGIAKIKAKDPTPYPQGLDRLMEFALSSLPQVTGINLEALGLAAREQANVLEQSRKQAAFGLLAPLFDALRFYRKSQGRVFLFYIRNYLSDGRLIRISGPQSAQVVPLIRVPDASTYDIIVDQSPNAPDVKQRTWETLVQILPGMMKAGMPIPPALLDFTPLPVSLAQEWKSFIAQQGANADPEQMKKAMDQMKKLQEENMRLQQQVRDKSGELQLKREEAAQNLELKRIELNANLGLQRMEAEGKRELEISRLGNDMEVKRFQATSAADTARRAATAGAPGESDDSSQLLEQLDVELSAALTQLAGALQQISTTQQAVVQAVESLQAAVLQPKVARMPDGRTITVSSGQLPQ